jgi:hypothetical protein
MKNKKKSKAKTKTFEFDPTILYFSSLKKLESFET